MERKPNKQDARSERTRTALVAAARPLFAEKGFAAVGTEEVARAAGVTRGALYHQFADKTELFAAVFEELEAEVTARLAAGALAEATDPIEGLKAGAREMLELASEPGVERIALIDAPAVLGWDRFREIGLRYGLGLVSGALEAAMEAGRIEPGPALPLAHVLVGALDEGALYVARAADKESARAEVAEAFDRVVEGLRRAP